MAFLAHLQPSLCSIDRQLENEGGICDYFLTRDLAIYILDMIIWMLPSVTGCFQSVNNLWNSTKCVDGLKKLLNKHAVLSYF